ncbi:MAG: UDP-N-acetylglucosamine 4,6-dehydratase (inverting) [Candidatus Omnitrophica bacterium]|nr:UDP-N-acetylglucosamine 4,6-dehydratase (inverting) [Candidatus Omnitrophota bacterium]
MKNLINGKVVLITGGTGSLGKKLVQIIVQEYKPEKLIVFSRDELKQFEMAQKWSEKKYPFIRYFLGDVRDKERLMRAFGGVDCVIHAAALKQVPAAEYNPCECIKTNILGAMNVIDAAIANKVKKVVALSTDKACNPVNLYGATKLCSDKLFSAARVYSGFHDTKFCVVRYGNVLGSRGSVIPFFKEWKKTGVLPVTDSRMTRFWITLDQAAHFVLFTLSHMEGGETFVPKIPSMRITDLAKAIGPDCKHEIIGIRPGEKIHEVLIGEDDSRNTLEFNRFYIINPCKSYQGEMSAFVDQGKNCLENFEYTSENNTVWMSVKDLAEIVGRISNDYSIEKSRWLKEGAPV